MNELPDALTVDDARALYEQAPCGYLSTTPDGLIVQVNETFERWTGHRRQDLIGRRRFADLLTGGGRIFHETHYAPLLQMQGRAREIALDIVCADGRRIPMLVNAVLERGDEHRPAVIRAVLIDATERRQYERQLMAAKLRAEQSEQRTRELVQTLQQALLPPDLPAVEGVEVAAVYNPADAGEIGGDFYDVFQVAADDWVFAIGDVEGKGTAAALVTSLARHTLRAAAVDHRSPADMLRVLNDVLVSDDTDRLCTAAVLRLHAQPGGWRCVVSCAGHPLPILGRSGAEGSTREIGRSGTLLGYLREASFQDTEVDVSAGDTMVLYTDGVSEARRSGDFFGEAPIHRAVEQAWTSAEAVAGRLRDDVLSFVGTGSRDDLAAVVVHISGRGSGPPASG